MRVAHLLVPLSLAGAGCGRLNFDGLAGSSPDAGSAVCNELQSDSAYFGSGTATDPYVVCTAPQFAHIGTDATLWSSSFVLGRSIDLMGQALVPIGNTAQPFTGTLDGQGLTIDNATLSFSGSGGVFGETNGASLHDFDLMNADVQGTDHAFGVGLLIGVATNTNLRAIQAVGTVHGPTEADHIQQSAGLVGIINANAGASAYEDLQVSLTAANAYDSVAAISGTVNIDPGAEFAARRIRTRFDMITTSVTQNTFAGAFGHMQVFGVGIVEDVLCLGEIDAPMNGAFVGGVIASDGQGGAGSSLTVRRVASVMTLRTFGRYPGFVGGIGGLIGIFSSSGGGGTLLLEQSYSSSTVTLLAGSSVTQVGGFIGQFSAANAVSATIRDVYSTQNVHCEGGCNGVSPLIGTYIKTASPMTIERVYTTGRVLADVPASIQNQGAVIGSVEDEAPTGLTDVFWDADAQSGGPVGSMLGVLAGTSGLTEAQLKSASTYSAWDPTVWNIVDGQYPSLRNAPLP